MIQLCVRWQSGDPILEIADIPVDALPSQLCSRLDMAAGRPVRVLIRANSEVLNWQGTISLLGLQDGETLTAN